MFILKLKHIIEKLKNFGLPSFIIYILTTRIGDNYIKSMLVFIYSNSDKKYFGVSVPSIHFVRNGIIITIKIVSTKNLHSLVYMHQICHTRVINSVTVLDIYTRVINSVTVLDIYTQLNIIAVSLVD